MEEYFKDCRLTVIGHTFLHAVSISSPQAVCLKKTCFTFSVGVIRKMASRLGRGSRRLLMSSTTRGRQTSVNEQKIPATKKQKSSFLKSQAPSTLLKMFLMYILYFMFILSYYYSFYCKSFYLRFVLYFIIYYFTVSVPEYLHVTNKELESLRGALLMQLSLRLSRLCFISS